MASVLWGGVGSCHQRFHSPVPPRGWELKAQLHGDPGATEENKTRYQVMNSLMPTTSSSPSPADTQCTAMREELPKWYHHLPSAAGLRNQTGVNSHLTLTHISTSTEAKTPSQTVNSAFPHPPLSWNEGHSGSNWCPAFQDCSLGTMDTSVPFLLGLPKTEMTPPHTHTLVHERQVQSFLYHSSMPSWDKSWGSGMVSCMS